MVSVAFVTLNSDAYLACLTHALSNETEEVMGLCIGQTIEKEIGYEIHISAVMLLRRMDKRKDRVEISVEQLSNASTVAENLAKKTGKPLRIVGWYHSHPHITVWPSHVDVQTQAMYQMMDETFVGLIFSCFNQSKSSSLYMTKVDNRGLKMLTVDEVYILPNIDGLGFWKDYKNKLKDLYFDIDPIQMHAVEVTCFQSRTNHDWDPPQYERLEIPMYVKKNTTISEVNLQTLTNLPNTLIEEETQAFDTVVRSCGDHVLTNIHNAAVHAQTVCNITETISSPLLHALEATDAAHKKKLSEILDENKELLKQIEILKDKLANGNSETESTETA